MENPLVHQFSPLTRATAHAQVKLRHCRKSVRIATLAQA